MFQDSKVESLCRTKIKPGHFRLAARTLQLKQISKN